MKHLAIALLGGLVVSSCSGSSMSQASPSPTSPTTLNSMTGTWSGTSKDSTGQETMSWTVTQSGGSLAGSMGLSDGSRGMMGSGTITGTVNDRTVTFHMGVPNGGFAGVMSSCSMSVDGQATMSDDGHTMTGTYAGNMSGMMSGTMSGMMGQMQSCGGPMSNGQFTLTR